MVAAGDPAGGMAGRYGQPILWASRFGRHKLSPTPEPEEILGRLFGGHPCWRSLARRCWQPCADLWAVLSSAITPLRGALVGLVMGVLTTLGDLGESMIKRQVGVKDSG